MRHSVLSFTVSIATVTLLTCWPDAQQAAAQPHAPVSGAPSAHSSGGAAAESAGSTTGKVVETMNSGGYTYVQVDDGSKKIWAAAPQLTVAVGDRVIVPAGMPMRDFTSKTLNRTFDVVYFVPSIQVLGAKAASEQVTTARRAESDGIPGHGGAGAKEPAAAVDLSNIKKAEGGQTVAELFAEKAALAGKEVVVRGRVVKYTPSVMGKNWIHLRDGSGGSGTDDLTVTTSADAAVGKTVLVRGKLSTDKDYGFGYHYDVIIEDATVTVE